MDLENFFLKKTDFGPKITLFGLGKNGRFSVDPAGTRSVVIVDHIFMASSVPPSFVDHGPKLRVLIINGQKLGFASETDQ